MPGRQGRVALALGLFALVFGVMMVRHADRNPIVRTVPVGINGSPSGMTVIDRQAGRVFVVSDAEGTMYMLDARNGMVLTHIAGLSVVGLAVDEATGEILAAIGGNSAGVGSVSFLDARRGTLLRTVAVGHQTTALAVDGVDRHVFVTNEDDGSVTMLDAGNG